MKNNLQQLLVFNLIYLYIYHTLTDVKHVLGPKKIDTYK
jgi:hypothetical protein